MKLDTQERELQIPITGGYGISRAPFVNSQNLINMYVSYNSSRKKNFLSYSSGITTPIQIPVGSEIRALYAFNNRLYGVCSDTVFFLDTALVYNFIGNITTSTGYVGISSNNAQQVSFVDGVQAWIFDPTVPSFLPVTTPSNPPQPLDITFLDGYFIIASGFQNNFFVSALNNGMSYDPLQFAIFQSVPDTLVACRTFKRRLYLFGNISTEVWTDSGTPDFPLRRDNTILLEHGVYSPKTISQGFERLVYLSQDKNGSSSVMLNTGYLPQKISTPEVEYTIQNLVNNADADGFLYRENGDVFYQLNFTQGNLTLLYNFTTDTWSQLRTEALNRHPGRVHAFFNNNHYMGDFSQPYIYPFSHQYLNNDGTVATRTIITPPLRTENFHRFRYDRIQLKVNAGTGTSTFTNDYDPIVYLSLSKNAGLTFGNRIQAEVGKIGQFEHRCIWRNLGVSRDFCMKFEFYHDLPFYVDSCSAYGELMPE